MRRPRLSTAAAFLLVLAPAAAAAADATIDCAKAGQADETAICADAALMADDARMAALYANAMAISGMGERGDLEDGQTSWLAQRRDCKADTACLRTRYMARIAQLRTIIEAVTTRGP